MFGCYHFLKLYSILQFLVSCWLVVDRCKKCDHFILHLNFEASADEIFKIILVHYGNCVQFSIYNSSFNMIFLNPSTLF